jgi:FKBP-type peptidyl-prolyl cis-trans isomerase FklB
MMSDNLQEGRDFLTKKEGEDGVVALPSGLLYKVIEAGDGATPGASDSVTVHYRGTLIDGTVFDSSYDRGQPATFPVNRVIAGWIEALQLMTEGSKWELYIPSEMAYGRGGAGADIGPDCALVFDVELINIA